MELRLGFLASHGGSSMKSIVTAIREGRLAATARVVISNNGKSEVPVRDDDRLETLAARVKKREQEFFVEVLQSIASGQLRVPLER